MTDTSDSGNTVWYKPWTWLNREPTTRVVGGSLEPVKVELTEHQSIREPEVIFFSDGTDWGRIDSGVYESECDHEWRQTVEYSPVQDRKLRIKVCKKCGRGGGAPDRVYEEEM